MAHIIISILLLTLAFYMLKLAKRMIANTFSIFWQLLVFCFKIIYYICNVIHLKLLDLEEFIIVKLKGQKYYEEIKNKIKP